MYIILSFKVLTSWPYLISKFSVAYNHLATMLLLISLTIFIARLRSPFLSTSHCKRYSAHLCDYTQFIIYLLVTQELVPFLYVELVTVWPVF